MLLLVFLSTSVVGTAAGAHAETDPDDLSWLTTETSCQEFIMKINSTIGTVEAIDSLPPAQNANYMSAIRNACNGKLGQCGLGICTRLRWNQSESGVPLHSESVDGGVKLSSEFLQSIKPVQLPARSAAANHQYPMLPGPRPTPPPESAAEGSTGEKRKTKTPFYDPRAPRLLEDVSSDGKASIQIKGDSKPTVAAAESDSSESPERAALINQVIAESDTNPGGVQAGKASAAEPAREPVDADVEVVHEAVQRTSPVDVAALAKQPEVSQKGSSLSPAETGANEKGAARAAEPDAGKKSDPVDPVPVLKKAPDAPPLGADAKASAAPPLDKSLPAKSVSAAALATPPAAASMPSVVAEVPLAAERGADAGPKETAKPEASASRTAGDLDLKKSTSSVKEGEKTLTAAAARTQEGKVTAKNAESLPQDETKEKAVADRAGDKSPAAAPARPGKESGEQPIAGLGDAADDLESDPLFAPPPEEPEPPKRGLDDPSGVFPRPPLELAQLDDAPNTVQTESGPLDLEGQASESGSTAPTGSKPEGEQSGAAVLPVATASPIPSPQRPQSDAAPVDSGTVQTVTANDPIAWLKSDLSCELLLDQMKARYTPLGGFMELPEQKKEELRLVLAEICSPRFAHCGFSSCARLNDSDAGQKNPVAAKNAAGKKGPVTASRNTDSIAALAGNRPTSATQPSTSAAMAGPKAPPGKDQTPQAGSPDGEAIIQARNKLDALLAIDRSDRIKAIRIAREREAKEKLEWRRASVTEEVEALKEIRSQSRSRGGSDESDPPDSGTGQDRYGSSSGSRPDGGDTTVSAGSPRTRDLATIRRQAREREERKKAREAREQKERESAGRDGGSSSPESDSGSGGRKGPSGSGKVGGKRAPPPGLSF